VNKKVLAIDFETANSSRSSACSIGIALYEGGEVKLNKELLINPEEDFEGSNIKIHGITPKTVKLAPKFPKVWELIDQLIDENTLVISPNASFDISVLRHVCDKYEMNYPTFEYLCTWKLNKIIYEELQYIDIDFKHRKASKDALICLNLYKDILSDSGYESIDDLLNGFNIEKGKLISGAYKPFGIKKYKHRREINIDEIKAGTYNFDNNHPFYKKSIVFTGTLESMKRVDAMKKVTNVGGIPSNSITKNTNYLVIGLNKKQKSSKLIRAENLILEGVNLQVIGEVDFWKLLEIDI
jgi:DNA polymerase-3 subunit epsilon